LLHFLQVVTTIASVADTCEEQFVTYYDRLMPCLKYIIQNANQQEHKILRGKTIECVSLIGLAVGPEKVTKLLIPCLIFSERKTHIVHVNSLLPMLVKLWICYSKRIQKVIFLMMIRKPAILYLLGLGFVKFLVRYS